MTFFRLLNGGLLAAIVAATLVWGLLAGGPRADAVSAWNLLTHPPTEGDRAPRTSTTMTEHPRERSEVVKRRSEARSEGSLVREAEPGVPERSRVGRAPPDPGPEVRRIASSSSRADQILVRLIPRDRIAAVTAISQKNDPITFFGLPTIPSLDDVEAILSTNPDLVVVNGFFDPRRVARLRENGLRVRDLGPLDDLDGFVADILELGDLVGRPARARDLARGFVDRMRQVAADVPPNERPRAMYLAQFGGKLYGGASGTSYHDVLVHGGLVDAAAHLEGWPELDPETVLGIAPDYIVTSAGMGPVLCAHVGIAELRACEDPARVVEVEAKHLGDPGLGMLDAAEAIRRAVHGAPKPPSRGDGRGATTPE
jgi:iron complex transport system substrate-binding protein